MDNSTAKKIIASYLSGYRDVSREELRQACEAVRSDRQYLDYLKDELGLSEDWTSECDVFIENAAEFCEMTGEERKREMPDMLAHLDRCPSCLRAYWDIEPLWISRAATAARAITRELGHRIRLVIDSAGRLRQQGLGPPALEYRPIAAALSGPPSYEAAPDLPTARATARKEWSLKDDEAVCNLRIVLDGAATGGAALTCSIEYEAPAPRPDEARIEIREASTSRLYLAGKLSDFESEPILLPTGSWQIIIQSSSHAETRSWRIPLEIEAESEDSL
jgi:hypothetical protein